MCCLYVFSWALPLLALAGVSETFEQGSGLAALETQPVEFDLSSEASAAPAALEAREGIYDLPNWGYFVYDQPDWKGKGLRLIAIRPGMKDMSSCGAIHLSGLNVVSMWFEPELNCTMTPEKSCDGAGPTGYGVKRQYNPQGSPGKLTYDGNLALQDFQGPRTIMCKAITFG